MGIGRTTLESWVRQLKVERAEKALNASLLTPEQEKSVTLKRKLSVLKKKRKFEKSYRFLDVRLPKQFSRFVKLKKSYTVKWLCELFGVHRSSYRYWVNKDKTLSSKRVLIRT